jgi:hypothetical protein
MPGYDPFPQRDLGWISYSMFRPLIELVVRQRVAQYTNIILYPHCRAQKIEATPRGTAVAAVRFEHGDGRKDRLPADLVVDASGRGALALGFLESIGHPQPQETIIEVNIGYSTAIFAIPDNISVDWKGVRTFAQAPQYSRGGLMLPGGELLDADAWRTPRRQAARRWRRVSGLCAATADPDDLQRYQTRRARKRRRPLRFSGERVAAFRTDRTISARIEVQALLRPRSVLRDPNLVERVQAVAATV